MALANLRAALRRFGASCGTSSGCARMRDDLANTILDVGGTALLADLVEAGLDTGRIADTRDAAAHRPLARAFLRSLRGT